MHFWDYVLRFFETLGMRLFGSAVQTATMELQRAGVTDADIDALEQFVESAEKDPQLIGAGEALVANIDEQAEKYLTDHGIELDPHLTNALLSLLHHENMVQQREQQKNNPQPQKQGTQSP